jgi:hypothetical protein
MLTARQAADTRADDAVTEAHQSMTRQMQANGGNHTMAFRNGLRKITPELKARLISVFGRLYGVCDEGIREQLVAEIDRRGIGFIRSCYVLSSGPRLIPEVPEDATCPDASGVHRVRRDSGHSDG